MYIEIRNSENILISKIEGVEADRVIPLMMNQIVGKKKMAHYVGDKEPCVQIIVKEPTKTTLSIQEINDYTIYLWEGYKINFRENE